MKQLEELKTVPARSEKETAELKKKLEKLEDDHKREEGNLEKVMESLKTETQVNMDRLKLGIQFITAMI